MPPGPRWFSWRYAAAGLGWGVLVGAVSGLVAVVWLLLVNGSPSATTGVGDLGLVVWALLLAPLYGAVVGAVAGSFAGLVCAVTLGRVRDLRRARWAALAVSSVAAVAGLLLAQLLLWDASVEALPARVGEWLTFVGVAALPALAGGALMALTTPSILRRTAPPSSS